MMAALQQLIKTIESAKQSIQQAPDDQQPIDDVCGSERMYTSWWMWMCACVFISVCVWGGGGMYICVFVQACGNGMGTCY